MWPWPRVYIFTLTGNNSLSLAEMSHTSLCCWPLWLTRACLITGIAGTQVDTLMVQVVAGVGLCRLYGFEAVFDIHGDILKYNFADGGQDDLILPRSWYVGLRHLWWIKCIVKILRNTLVMFIAVSNSIGTMLNCGVEYGYVRIKWPM